MAREPGVRTPWGTFECDKFLLEKRWPGGAEITRQPDRKGSSQNKEGQRQGEVTEGKCTVKNGSSLPGPGTTAMVTDVWTEPARDASPHALSITHFMEVVAGLA